MPELRTEVARLSDRFPSALASIKVVYVRYEDEWQFLIGRIQLVTEQERETELEQVYPQYAFVGRCISGFSCESFLDAITGEGCPLSQTLPPLKVTINNSNWSEQLIPSHITGTGFPSRQFSARIAQGQGLPNDVPLIAFGMPYYPSASTRIKDSFNLNDFHGNSDVRKGELSIEVPDKRAAILLEEESLSIRPGSPATAIVGQINGQDPFTLLGNESIFVDMTHIKDIDVWLVTKDNELLDYRSSSAWPFRYETHDEVAKSASDLAEIIQQGESETCEFKAFIDLTDQNKATEIEKSVCALSNLKGGKLFIGINDEGEVIGLSKGLLRMKSTRKADITLSEYVTGIKARLRETLMDAQCCRLEAIRLFGIDIVVVTVEPSRETNFLLNSGNAYIRRGATSKKMSPQDITQVADRRESSYEY